MLGDKVWKARQLKLELLGSAAPVPLPVTLSKELSETLEELLFLAGRAIAERATSLEEARDEN
jgi:hypothetical protein